MPEGHFERLRLGGLVGCWAVLFFYAKDPAARSPDHTMARQPRPYGGSQRGRRFEPHRRGTVALMVAIATTIGVGILIESFRIAVGDWLYGVLRADLS